MELDFLELRRNPIWALYCQSEDRRNEAQLEHDEQRYPSSRMTPFILWNQERMAEFGKEHPDALSEGNLVDYNRYEAWLLRWVNRKIDNEIDTKLLELGVKV